MIGKSLGFVIDNCAETVINASEVADFGAVKPNGFGSLSRKQLSSDVVYPKVEDIYLSEFPNLTTFTNLYEPHSTRENPYLSLRYNDISKECSEYMCDCGIIPWAWQEADLEQKIAMLRKATEIIAKELNLPEKWVHGIVPIVTSGGSFMAQASCCVRLLNNGGVDIVGIPSLSINLDYLTDDYFEAMATIYHEMIHMKQYASIDGVIPRLTNNSVLLDLINDLKMNAGMPKSRVNYLYSPYEAEAWAQEAYFKRMLEAVIWDRYS